MAQPLAFFQAAFEAAPVGILIVNDAGTIVLVNRQVEALFGYAREELVSQPVEMLVPARFRPGHPATRAAFTSHPVARPMGAGRDLYAVRKDGREVPVEIGLSPIHTAEGVFVSSSIIDLTERRELLSRLEASLQEKEVLLRELHHRAKNNLQLIASLLDLAQAAPGRDVVSECRDRINSIALVHERLYQSGTFALIALDGYLRALTEQVAQAWAQPASTVVLRVDADGVSLPLDAAIPCGLIVNELVTNAFKHAFPKDRGGTITVTATQEGARVKLTVRDDGVGLPAGPTPRGHIGLELVHALAR